MDEPLSNLDAKLRVQMRTEVSRLQADLGTTTVYVTHDQTEAMTLGDRVAVMRAGVLQQVGSPADLYADPANLFVAGFIGSPSMNFMPGKIEGDTVVLPIGKVPIPAELREKLSGGSGTRDVVVGVRPESFEDARAGRRRARQGLDLQGEDRPRRVDGLGEVRLLQGGGERDRVGGAGRDRRGHGGFRGPELGPGNDRRPSRRGERGLRVEPSSSSGSTLARCTSSTRPPGRAWPEAREPRAGPPRTARRPSRRIARPSHRPPADRPPEASRARSPAVRFARAGSALELAAHQMRQRVVLARAAAAQLLAQALEHRSRPSDGCEAAGSAG